MNNTIQKGSYLPFFSGFYHSFHDSRVDIKEDDIEYLAEYINNKIDNEKDHIKIDYDDICDFVDFKKAQKEYSELYTNEFYNVFEEHLQRLGIERIDFEALISPKYYNYSTDSINAQYTINKKTFTKEFMRMIIKHSENWAEYLKKYKSCSGFSSSFSENPSDWDIETVLNCEHSLGSFVEFYLEDILEDPDCEIMDGIEFSIMEYFDFEAFDSLFDPKIKARNETNEKRKHRARNNRKKILLSL